MTRRLFLFLCCLLIGALASSPSAHASFGLESANLSVEEAPSGVGETDARVEGSGAPDTQAGSHPYQVRTTFHFNATKTSSGQMMPEGNVKDLEVELPPGLIGNSTNLPHCSEQLFSQSGFENQGCPSSTQIGIITLETTLFDLTVPVFNLVPPPGVVASFGTFVLAAPVKMDVAIRTYSDFGMTVSLPDNSDLLPLLGGSLTLWGVPADPRHDALRGSCLQLTGESDGSCPSESPPTPFLTLGTSCATPTQATIRVDSWQEPGVFATRQMSDPAESEDATELTGCERLDFSPTIEAKPETTAADSPTGLSIDVRMPQNEDPLGRSEAALEDAEIALPPGVSINPAAADGLGGCAPGQIELQDASEPACPGDSALGTVEIQTPLLARPLNGSIYLAQPYENIFGSPLAVYLTAGTEGLMVKLAARVEANPSTGQLSLSLLNAPAVPISEVKLSFDGGPRAPLGSPESCGTFTVTANLSSYAQSPATPPTATSSGFDIDHGCGGGFTPVLIAGATSALAGGNTGFGLQLTRADGEQQLGSVSVELPPGLLANLGAVPLCGEVEASSASCHATSQIGSVSLAAGSGSHPYYFSGSVFLTGPYAGAPFGLAIEVPAIAGPFELGTITVRAQIEVNQTDAHITIRTDALPSILAGIPLRLRAMDIILQRPGFMVNPTSCRPGNVLATVTSSGGASVRLSSPFAITGCSRLAFSPQISASTQALVSRRGGAALTMVLRYPGATQSNLQALSLGFPKQFSPRLTTIQSACPQSSFASDPAGCPMASLIGSATVATRMLEVPLKGPVYLVSREDGLPRVVLVLQGQGVTLRIAAELNVSRKGAITTDFNAIPDAPITSFQVQLPRGRHSILGPNALEKAQGELCGKRLDMPVTATAQNDAQVARSVRISIEGCKKQAIQPSKSGRKLK